ncbi:CHC2 zinc finger domain-containing protein [Flavobacterium covae]|uniref:CHC2 zinc finger domain-containing protein n=1 Tax=Flavobacterium covae TaxID=2906076 RepID=UPI0007C5C2C3|nr:CHC2 zinc finger domain-containing protein [Flavobacterium covae]
MEITQIKEQLTMSNVLHYYGLKTDKQSRLNCPFHEDKTPSFQVYYKTQTAYCFSSNCKTHGKSIDVIDFILYKENCTKHEAINKAKEILNHAAPNKNERYQQDLSKEQFLTNMFQYFKNAISNSKPAKEYLQSRSLDNKKIEVGYNGGQFHHGARKDETLINQCLEYGLLIDKGNKGRTGETAYNVFGKWCIVFALKNRENKVVSLYFRSTVIASDSEANSSNKKQIAKHFYLKNRQGLYPNYPKQETKKLILTEAIIDTATLLQVEEITKEYSVLSLYGTNGLTEEHTEAVSQLKQLEEIIFFFDGDNAGNEAINKYSEVIREIHPTIKITKVNTPENEDINSLVQGHTEEILLHLINERTELNFSFSIEDTTTEQPKKPTNSNTQPSTTIDILKQKDLLNELNKLIEQSGIIGEENSRLLLYIIASSYKTKHPLHAIVQGSSGSGKTHLISKIADLMPIEDVFRFTRITESSLYNWGEFDLVHKVIVIEDLDGLKEEALYPLRELISNQRVSSSTSVKDKKGNIKSTNKEVKGIFSSLSATTKGETYEDNMSRSFLIAVDESTEQSKRIIQYQNKKYAGEIDPKQQEKAKHQLQQITRALKEYDVVNQYATQLELPEEVHKIRRLNEMFQSIIKQITIINQYQRKTTNDGRLITQIEDLEQATEVLFESIILKVDELDGSLRQFFERLKKHLKTQEKEFTQREIRQILNISKAQCSRYINNLLELEYISSKHMGNLRKITYKIEYWDDYQRMRIRIKDKLLLQIENLKNK